MSKESDSFALVGGVDTETPYISRTSGSLIISRNFAPEPDGGYKLLPGYERFDGRESPTRTRLLGIVVTPELTGAGPSVGTVLTGSVSGATVAFIGQSPTAVFVYAATGEIQVGEVLQGYPTVITCEYAPVRAQQVADATVSLPPLLKAGREYLRGRIQQVPGSGPVLAAWQRGDTFAWRNNSAGTAAIIYRSTAAGWVPAITTPIAYVKFNLGVRADPFVIGDVITGGTSGAVGTISQIATGGADRKEGMLALKSVTGAFVTGEDLTVLAVLTAKVRAPSAVPAIAPGGRYQICSRNFNGDALQETIYFANGVGPCWAFDGESLLFLETGLSSADERPTLVAEHMDHLWLGYDYGQLQASVIGEPLSFDGSLGAASFALGARLSNIISGPSALLVTTEQDIQVIYGKDPKDFRKETISTQLSALPYTGQYLGVGLVMAPAGIVALNRVDAFGNFQDAVVSDRVRRDMRTLVAEGITETVVHRADGYYMVFGAKGNNYLLAQSANQTTGLMPFTWGTIVRFASMNEKALLFTDDSGYVFEAFTGASHDGAAREFYLQTSYAFQGAPNRRKRYRRLTLSCGAYAPFAFGISTVYSKGAPYIASSEVFAEALGGGGRWDLGEWDQIVWDGQDVPELFSDIDGVGTDISIIIYGVSDEIETFTLEDIVIQFSPRGSQR